jgi:hypothetical protein
MIVHAPIIHPGTHLFGFDVRQLIGRHVSSFLDILRETPGSGKLGHHASIASQVAAAGAGTAAGGAAGTTAGGDAHAIHHHERGMDALMELAQRSTEDPGSSWRVGVSMPVDEEDLALLGPMAAAMLQQRTHPAVMTLAVSFQLPQAHDAGDIAPSEDSGGGVVQKGTSLLIGSPGGMQASLQAGGGLGAGRAPAAVRALQHQLYSNPAFSPQMGVKRGTGSFLFSGPPEPIAESTLHVDDGRRRGGLGSSGGAAGGGAGVGANRTSQSFWFPYTQQGSGPGPVAEGLMAEDAAPGASAGIASLGAHGIGTGGNSSIAPTGVLRSKLGPLMSSSLVEDEEAAEALMMQHQLLLDSADSLRHSSPGGPPGGDHEPGRVGGPRPKTTPVGTRRGAGQQGGFGGEERTSTGFTTAPHSPELSLHPPGSATFPVASPVDEVTQELFPHEATYQNSLHLQDKSSSLTRGVSNNYSASQSPFTASNVQQGIGGMGGGAGAGAVSSLPPHMRGNKTVGIAGHSLGGAGGSLMGTGTLARAASLRPAMLFAAAQAAASASLPMNSKGMGGGRSGGNTPPMTANNSMTRVSQPNAPPQLIHSSGGQRRGGGVLVGGVGGDAVILHFVVQVVRRKEGGCGGGGGEL